MTYAQGVWARIYAVRAVPLRASERVALHRAGNAAYRAGQPSTVCPYETAADLDQAARARAWLSAWLRAERRAEAHSA